MKTKTSKKVKSKPSACTDTHAAKIAYSNCPNKDIIGEIHRGCFDYRNMERKAMEKTIKERIYVAYNGVFMVIKGWIEADQQDFLDFVRKMKIDKTC